MFQGPSMPEQAVISDCTLVLITAIKKSVASDFGRSFLSLVTSTSTRSQHTATCPDASAFHYLSDVASLMTTLSAGKTSCPG